MLTGQFQLCRTITHFKIPVCLGQLMRGIKEKKCGKDCNRIPQHDFASSQVSRNFLWDENNVELFVRLVATVRSAAFDPREDFLS